MGGERSEPCYADRVYRVPKQLTANARSLRNNATKAERLLWRVLSQFRPRFTRQLVVGPYIVDLACRQARVAVELDGGQHVDAVSYDQRRTEFLIAEGWAVLRFWNNEVLENLDGVAELILNSCTERLGGTHPQPLPSREGRQRKPRSR